MGIKNGEYIWFFWNLTFLKGNESAKVKKKEKNERISFFSQVESYDQKGLAEIEKNLKKKKDEIMLFCFEWLFENKKQVEID